MSGSIILFDGICNLCDGVVNFVIRKNKKNNLKLATLQSNAGQQLLQQFGLDKSIFNSFVFIKNGKVYTKSTAALKVCKHLNGAWPLMYGFIIVPKFIRDGVYTWIAKNRYKWFGKKDQCMVPTPELRSRFLV